MHKRKQVYELSTVNVESVVLIPLEGFFEIIKDYPRLEQKANFSLGILKDILKVFRNLLRDPQTSYSILFSYLGLLHHSHVPLKVDYKVFRDFSPWFY